MIPTIIIEDENPSLLLLEGLIKVHCPDINILGTAKDVEEGILLIREKQPELIFLDVELQTGTGFDIISKLEDVAFEIIFTTAYEHYAIEAIRFSSLYYLLKPISKEELCLAVEKARSKINQKWRRQKLEALAHNLEHFQAQKICVTSMDEVTFVNLRDILYCEGQGAYTKLVLKKNRQLLASKNLKEFESLLPVKYYMRIHKSYLINLQEVKRYVKTGGGYVEMSNLDQLALAQRKKTEFMARVAGLM